MVLFLTACGAPAVPAPTQAPVLEEIGAGPQYLATPVVRGTHRLECSPGCAIVVDGQRVPVESAWLDSLGPRDFGPATTVQMGGGRTLVHLFTYAIAPGSMGAATGRDVFLLLEGGAARPVITTTGAPTMHRSRGTDPWAESHTFLVADVDQDGLVDVGRIIERVLGPWAQGKEGPESLRDGFLLTQSPVRWSLGSADWAEGDALEGTLPPFAHELPRPSAWKTATDYVMDMGSDGSWEVDTSVVWNPPPRQEPDPELFVRPRGRR